MSVPQFLLLLGSLVGIATLILSLTSQRFKEATDLQTAAIREAEHLRARIEDVRRERDQALEQLKIERAKSQRSQARNSLRIAELEERVHHMQTRERAYRKLLAARGIQDDSEEAGRA